MSRKTVIWTRKFKQAGSLSPILPQYTVRYDKRGVLKVVTYPMRQDRLERLMNRFEKMR